jgi:hypothetical protein
MGTNGPNGPNIWFNFFDIFILVHIDVVLEINLGFWGV